MIVDSAWVATGDACARVPRATGTFELGGGAGQATEFIAMARTQAPDGRGMPGDPEVDRRMQVLGPILAERALRARSAQLPAWSTALRQIFPFPVSESRDLAFTSTFLVDDELAVGNDTTGYSLFVVYTPQAQSGYDTAYVAFTDYPTAGKAAPRVIDFLDWNRDGAPELLLDVYGTERRWFEAVGRVGDRWQRILDGRCRPAAARAVAADTGVIDTGDTTEKAKNAAQRMVAEHLRWPGRRVPTIRCDDVKLSATGSDDRAARFRQPLESRELNRSNAPKWTVAVPPIPNT